MHEIVGTILHCLERELEAWTSSSSFQQVPEHFLRGALSEETVEAHTYWIFTRWCLFKVSPSLIYFSDLLFTVTLQNLSE